MERTALYLKESIDLRGAIDYVKYAESQGFEAAWQAESCLTRDATVPMAAYAAVTGRIKIGSAVINDSTRNIGLLAATFLTLDDLAPSRIICGIGTRCDPLASSLGIDRTKPLTAMKETVLVLRRLLNMERVTFKGEFIHVEDLALEVVYGCCDPRQVPIMIGATGDQMLELTGEIADGVVLSYCVSPEYNDHALEILEKGARKSGRSLEDIDRPQVIICSVDQDHDRAIDSARRVLCQYLAEQPHLAKASGVSPEVVEQLQSRLGWPATDEQIEKAWRLVPEELVYRITASGTPAEVRTRVNEYRKHGCTCPILYPVGEDVRLLVDTFAQ
jgi:5,10-methylenetetrahydromethanopterin reductase